MHCWDKRFRILGSAAGTADFDGTRWAYIGRSAMSGQWLSSEIAKRLQDDGENCCGIELNANAAGKLVQVWTEEKNMSFMTPEQALVLALDDSPVHLPGFVIAGFADEG